jgi:FkbM family methyltransferase
MANLDRGTKKYSLIEKSGWWVPEADTCCFQIVQREVNDLQQILPLCKDFRRVVQAGGNIGIWPKRLSHDFETVSTFEPDSANYLALVENTKGIDNITATNAALGDRAARAGIDHIDPQNIGAHQIKEGNDFDVLTVDSFGWEDVDLLQLDVEGFEHFAILGAAETIQRSGPVICLELKGLGKRYGVEDEETVAFLAGLGYKITNRIHRDVIFTRA